MLEDIKSIMDTDEGAADKYKAIALCLLGEAYSKIGESEKAYINFEEGLKEAKKKESISEDEYCMFLDIAADNAEKLDEYSKAVEYISENALLTRKNEGETERFCQYLIRTSKLYCLQKRYSDAVVMYEKAADMYKELYGEKSEKYIQILIEICKAYDAEHKYDDIIVRLEGLSDYADKKKEIMDMLASSYKSTGSFSKFIKLKFGGKQ
ncbi:hypothetical protein SDC9_106181 [bioreactor metagenome]|uniref:MalT-like TPR region domain-containing protein n=1 Tax=bioreactor metagenome TaxID=1076179 RepID=A0A645B442_9ZZZZ